MEGENPTLNLSKSIRCLISASTICQTFAAKYLKKFKPQWEVLVESAKNSVWELKLLFIICRFWKLLFIILLDKTLFALKSSIDNFKIFLRCIINEPFFKNWSTEECFFCKLNSDSHLPKKNLFHLFQWKTFKSEEKWFIFYLKSSFHSQNI